MNIRARLIIGFSTLVIITILLVVLLYTVIGRANWYREPSLFPQNQLTQALLLRVDLAGQVGEARSVVFGISSGGNYRSYKNSALEDMSKWEALIKKEVAFKGGDARRGFGQEMRELEEARDMYARISSGLEEAIALKKDGRGEEATAETNEVVGNLYQKEFVPKIKEIVSERRSEVTATETDAGRAYSDAKTLAWALAIGGIIVGIVVSFLTIRIITSSLERLKESARQIGMGNLDVKVEPGFDDEFGALTDSFNRMARDLKRSRDDLENVLTELDGYANTVSHDLKSPISAIMMADDALLAGLQRKGEGLDVGELMELAETIGSGVRRANALVEDLLSLAQAGQVPDEVSDVDVSEVVGRIIKERSADIGEKGVKVVVGEDLEHLEANATHVYQVFTNLIGNAIKHNDSSEPVLTINHLGEAEGGGRRYQVRDNGSGIAPENIDTVFVPFFRGETGETGVGLAIVEKIVRLYGGETRAYNDGGAVFEFIIRAAPAKEDQV